MDNRITIGFVILTWNSEKYIYDCIKSIISNNVFDFYLSIFDNGSTDKTISIIESFRDDRIILSTSSKNIGTTKSRNIAYEKMPTTDVVCVLDSDTVINDYDNFVSMASLLLIDKTIGIIGPRLYNASHELQPSGRNLPSLGLKFKKVMPFKSKKTKKRIEDEEFIDYDSYNTSILYVGYLMSACVLMRYDLLKEINGFDEKIFYAPEDVEICARIWKNGYRVCYFKDCEILHYWQRISRKKLFSKHNFSHIKGLIYFSRKYNKKFRMKVMKAIYEYNGKFFRK